MNCAIVVPVYRDLKDEYERESFMSSCRVCKVSKEVDLFIVTYEKMMLSSYLEIGKRFGIQIHICFFDFNYFKNIHGYNQLMLSACFYQSFNDYDYMLICQLDAVLFKDNIIEWCDKGYDYIGAPLFAKNYYRSDRYAVVGNGGLSLRKISKFIYCLTTPLTLKELTHINRPYNPKYTLIKKILYWMMLCSLGRSTLLRGFLSHWVDEDTFYSYSLDGSPYKMKVPSIRDAAMFAFDQDHEFLYKYIENQIPFGVHKWNKKNSLVYKHIKKSE